MVTIPDILDPLKHIRWGLFDPWTWLRHFGIPFAGTIGALWRRQIKRRNARLAQHWPVVDGRVLDIDVGPGTKFFGNPRQFIATFHYSYSVQDGSEANYYSGDFARPFPDKERAWEWLELLKNQRIRVHISPDRPESSVVLAADLDAHFSLPARTPADFVLSPSAIRPE